MPYPKVKINSKDKNIISDWEPRGRNLLFFPLSFLLGLGEGPTASLMLASVLCHGDTPPTLDDLILNQKDNKSIQKKVHTNWTAR